jgi:hypothetical protein
MFALPTHSAETIATSRQHTARKTDIAQAASTLKLIQDAAPSSGAAFCVSSGYGRVSQKQN